MFKGKELNQQILAPERIGQHPALDEVVRRISGVFRVDEDRIRDKGARAKAARKVAIYFSKRYTGSGNDQIAST